MNYISHRVNNVEELKKLSINYGVEIDLRDDFSGRIYLQHDPFENGEDFEDYLKNYKHATMILNIKSERIEYKVLELLKKYQIKDYFFLDSTFPMIKSLSDIGEQNIAVRYSEYEGMDTLRAMSGKVEWIWIDCFTKLPLYHSIYIEMKELGYKLCLVSPELQGQGDKLGTYARQLKEENIHLDAVCTKESNIESWKCMLE